MPSEVRWIINASAAVNEAGKDTPARHAHHVRTSVMEGTVNSKEQSQTALANAIATTAGLETNASVKYPVKTLTARVASMAIQFGTCPRKTAGASATAGGKRTKTATREHATQKFSVMLSTRQNFIVRTVGQSWVIK